MAALDGCIDYVIGIDTHRDSHTAALLDARGGLCAIATVSTDRAGARKLLALASEKAQGRRIWALEGSGSYGAGLARFLGEQGEWLIEVDRPRRARPRGGAKSDELDALRAAREALARERLGQPRRGGEREALRVLLAAREGAVHAQTEALCQFAALILIAPERLRAKLRGASRRAQVAKAARLRCCPTQSIEQAATILALRSIARRALALQAEARAYQAQLAGLVSRLAPALLAEPGVGAISAARILCVWSHAGRIHSEAAFASLAGAAPIPASSGLRVRHRLNRGGDRQLNRALHTVALSRLLHDPETRAYAERRQAEGKSIREIRRCLKRYLARRFFRLLEAMPQPA